MSMMSGCACCADMLSQRFDRRRFLHMTATVGAAALLPKVAMAAEGNYEAMMLTCIDPRFPVPTMNYAKSHKLTGKYSQFSIAGASIGVVAPSFKDWSKAFWDNLGASMQLHHIPKVIVFNHRDCGAAKIAYGAEKVANAQIEGETHRDALFEFRRQLAERQPSLRSELGLMSLNGKVEIFG